MSLQPSHSQVLISLLFGDKLNSDGIEFGMEGSFNFSKIGSLEADQRLTTFNLGFYLDIRLKENWSLSTGLTGISKQGVENLSAVDLSVLGVEPLDEAGTYSQHIRSFLVPVLLKYQFPNRIYAEAGTRLGLNYTGWVQFESETDGAETRTRINNSDAINALEMGGMAGLGYRFRQGPGALTLGIVYYHGFTNSIKGESGSLSNSVVLKFKVPIGAGKKTTTGAAKKPDGR